MDLDYSEKGVVKLSMIKQLEKVFADFPEDLGKATSTPASDHLFQVRDAEETEREGKYLPADKVSQFHHTVAQLLFICCRVRRDIQTAVSFLMTRVKKPDEDDWGKLKRVLKYLKGTLFMKLMLSASDLVNIRWWVDASYNVHDDCKGHTGGMVVVGKEGKGAPLSTCRKQKLNVRSSCEGELVGIDDVLPSILWMRYFLENQGYTIEENILYQDNKSTILLANNGRWSSSKRTKHIKSRYFYIKDKVDQGEVSIQHQPTDKMWSDVLTKPKQGKGFRLDRAMLMNVPEVYDDEEERKKTHPKLLILAQGLEQSVCENSMLSRATNDQLQHRRSVLSKEQKQVTWKQNIGKVSAYDEKARVRHLEVVKARIMARRVKTVQKLGRE